MATLASMAKDLKALTAQVATLMTRNPIRGPSGSRGPRGLPGAPGTPGESPFLLAEPSDTLTTAVAAAAGKALVLKPGVHTLDASVAVGTTRIIPQHGAIIAVPSSRTLASEIDWSNGGKLQPAAGVAVTLTGRQHLPANHHAFDVSLGGTVQIKTECCPELTPENFGAKNDDTADDTAALRAWIAAFEWDATANRSIKPRLLPGPGYLFGAVQTDVAVDWGGVTHHEFISLYVTKSTICIEASIGANMHWKPTDLGLGSTNHYYGIRYEGTGPLLRVGMRNVLLRAGNAIDAANMTLLDLHDVRDPVLENIQINNFSNTAKTATGLRLRGRDAGRHTSIKTNCDLPILIWFNDDNTVGRDANGIPLAFRDTKDLDHWIAASLDLGVTDNIWRAAVLVGAGVVVRNLTLQELAAVGGGFVCVDKLDSGGVAFAGAAVAPRRASNHWEITQGRTEGLASIAGDAGVRIERHKNGRLRDLALKSYLLGEGSDARRVITTGGGAYTGIAWKGLVATGVDRIDLDGAVRYGGIDTPLTIDARCRVSMARTKAGRLVTALVPRDNGLWLPEAESHWAFLNIYESAVTTPQHFYLMQNPTQGGNITDEQVSGTDYPLIAGGTAPTYMQLVDEWHGGWLIFNESTGQRMHLNSTAAEHNPITTSQLWGGVFYIANGWTPGGTQRDILNPGGGNLGPLLRCTNGAGTLFLRANTTDGTASVNNWNNGHPFLALLRINHATVAIECLLIDLVTGTSETITVAFPGIAGAATVDNGANKCLGAYDGIRQSWSGGVRYLLKASGATAEQSLTGIATAMGAL